MATPPLTEAQRVALADRATSAVRTLLIAAGNPRDRELLPGVREVAEMAVTDAVVRADVPYRHVADLAGCSSLQIATLITDPTARGRALGSEREAARAHTERVRQACRVYAKPIVEDPEHSEVTVATAARLLRMTRKSLYELVNPPKPTPTT
jgi:hypothetical protein